MAKVEKNGQAPKGIEATITVPGDVCDSGYTRDGFEIGALTSEQAEALKRLTCSLRARNARCQRRDARTPLGIVVDKEPDSIRWLLDRLAEGYRGDQVQSN